MKRLIAVVAAVSVWANAAVPVPPIPRAISPPHVVQLKLSWEYPTNELSNDIVFRVYHATNIAAPFWTVLTNVIGGKTNVLVSMPPAVHYFTIKSYSVFWAYESDASGVTQTPPAPRSDIPLSIGRP